MRIKIDKISRKEIDTKYGKKWKLGVFSNNKWYSAWSQPWNRGWREGETIDVEITERQWNGKPMFDIVGLTQPQLSLGKSDLENKIGQVMMEVLQVKKMVQRLIDNGIVVDETPDPIDEDVPPDLDEINEKSKDSIPF